MGGKTTESGGIANQGNGGLHVTLYKRENTEACLQTDMEQQMHR